MFRKRSYLALGACILLCAPLLFRLQSPAASVKPAASLLPALADSLRAAGSALQRLRGENEAIQVHLSFALGCAKQKNDGDTCCLAQTSTSPRFLLFTLSPNFDVSVAPPLHEHGIFDPHVGALMDRVLHHGKGCNADANLVLDVGANYGLFGLYAAACGCRVKLYEMQPKLATLISHSAQLNGFSKVKVYNNAVFHDEAQVFDVPLDVPGNTGNFGILTREGKGGQAQARSVKIKALALDKHIHETVLFMKVDVEGSEVEVVRAMQRLLKERKVLHFLLEFGPSPQRLDEYAAILTNLLSYGYVLRVLAYNGIGPLEGNVNRYMDLSQPLEHANVQEFVRKLAAHEEQVYTNAHGKLVGVVDVYACVKSACI